MLKQKLLFVIMIVFILASSILIAQQEMKDQLYWVREEVVKVNMWDQYEQTSKQWVEMMTKGELDFPVILASQRDDGHYYYLIPFDNYAKIDDFSKIFGSAIEKAGKEKWQKMMVENESSMKTHMDFVVTWSSKYSYVPKEPRLKQGEAGFIHWIFFTYKLEKRKEVLDVLAEWKALYEKNNIPDGWSIWLPEIGLENNMIALTESAKDAGSFYTIMKENSDKLKEEEQKLWAKLSVNLLTIEQKYGKPRPDLGWVKE